MPGIGEVVTQADLKSLAAWSAANLSQTVYVAPTVYRPANGVSGWNYYATAKDALLQWLYINKVPGYNKIAAAGSISFPTKSATTLGINADFFAYAGPLGMVPAHYGWVKEWAYTKNKFPTLVFRFYKTNGAGPYYAILDNRYLNIAATKYTDVPANKVQALQDFNNTVQLLKARYNTLAKFVDDLSKRNKSAVEQQVFDESLLTLLRFENQLKGLKGIDIVWSTSGQISGPAAVGIVPLVWIAIIAVSGAVVAYAFDKITSYLKDAKALEQSTNTVQFVEAQRLKIAEALKYGTITRADADYLQGKLDETQKAAEKNITTVATKKDDDVFDKITKVLLIGSGIYLATKILK